MDSHLSPHPSIDQNQKRRKLAVLIAAVAVMIAVAYVAAASIMKSSAEGVRLFAQTMADSLSSLGFTRSDMAGEVAVLWGTDSVADLRERGSIQQRDRQPTAILILLVGRWRDTRAAYAARLAPELVGRLVEDDSVRLLVQLEHLRSPAHIKGYLLLAPDSRWIPLQ